MGSWRRAAAAGLLCLLWHLASSKKFQPDCHTDYVTKLVCYWEVDAVTNCTAEFKLLYQTRFAENPRECPPKNIQGHGSAPWCVCVILGDSFRGVKYNISLVRAEDIAKVLNNTIWDMDEHVKPRPLINLRVEKDKKNRTFILTWKRDDNDSETLQNFAAKYEVAYWPQNHTEQRIIVPEDSSRHTIFADKLRSDSTYEASVRHKLKYWKTWSEWSATCEWLNDFEPRSEKKSWPSIVWLCMMIISLILSCYLCFLWVKRKWWDRIPGPHKSKMAEDITAGKWLWVLGKMETAPYRRPFPSKGGADLPHQPLNVNREPFLIPEEVFLSKGSLTTESSAGGVKPGSPEEAEEETEQVPHEDAVAGLFRDLLRGALSGGDPGPPTTSAQSCSAPEKPTCLQGLCQPAYQACRVEPDSSELELPLSGQGPYASEGRADWLPGLESSLADPSCAALPQTESSPAAPSALGYKSFSSLEAQPVSGLCQWPRLAPEAHSQQAWGSTRPGLLLLPDTSGVFPAGQDAFSLYGAAAPGMWLFPAQQGEALAASALQAPGEPESLPGPKAAFFSSYRAFNCALQSSLASPELSLEPV